MDNGPARNIGNAQRIQTIGEAYGDPFEISNIRREVHNYFTVSLLITIIV